MLEEELIIHLEGCLVSEALMRGSCLELTWPRIRLAGASIELGIILLNPNGTAR
jgi:hypothetical protein